MNMNLKKPLLLVLPALFAVTAAQAQDAKLAKEPGINIQYLDKSVKPSDDFFRYVNGTWLNTRHCGS